ncbi:MAG: phosphonate ABC transporter substrate-binding protein [Alphaproteobacteria bacterium]|nr:phosphonate ABC transporter substrate-binding protein [Alphaproteobacteria bacterium]
MTIRRMLTAATAAAVVLTGLATDAAADWRDKYKTLKLGCVTTESQGATLTRFKPLAAYLEKKLGVSVEVFTASDYAGIVQALSGGHIQLGRLGPASYAAGYLDSNGGIEPLVMNVEPDGGKGYHSILIVNAGSPYKSLADLKGKTLAWADPNSTSGFLVPSVALRDEGVDPQKFFGRTIFAGGHEPGVIGVLKKNFDAAFTWTSPGHKAGQLRLMMDRNMMKLDDIRIIWTSPLIPNPLWSVPTDMPGDLKQSLTTIFLDLVKDDMKIAEAAAQGQTSGFIPVDHGMYKTIVQVAKEKRKSRRSR